MNRPDSASPRIERIAWGRMRIAGLGAGRDFKLWPGGGREWDWTETGTHHEPGIQPADVQELLEHGAETVVLSRGMLLRLRTRPDTLDLVRGKGVAVHVEETRAAAGIYNDLAAAGVRVGGLFHSTC